MSLLLATVLAFASCAKRENERERNQSQEYDKTRTESTVKKAEALQWVYIDNGALQCEKAPMPLSQTRDRLLNANIKVEKSQCAQITGVAVAAMCGLKDTGIHMHHISMKQTKKARSLGFEPMASLSHYGDKSFEQVVCPDIERK